LDVYCVLSLGKMTPRKSRKKRLVGWCWNHWKLRFNKDNKLEFHSITSDQLFKCKDYVKVRITIEEITPLNK
jgi:hypothetical protein